MRDDPADWSVQPGEDVIPDHVGQRFFPDPRHARFLTASRSQPLAASFARALAIRLSVSAAKPTITWPPRRLLVDSSRSMSGFSVSAIGSGAAPDFFSFTSLVVAGR